jgi:LCP family protein required for cell wall assembly
MALLAVLGVVVVVVGPARDHVQAGIAYVWLRPSAVQVAALSERDGPWVTWLIVGSDRRPEGTDLTRLGYKSGERADAIALLSIDPAGRLPARVYRISRELMTDNSEYGRQRIAGLLSYGPSALVEVLREEANVPIHHYLQVDMPAVIAAVDAMGGVEVDVGATVRDRVAGLSLSPGEQVLSGQDALSLARSRSPEMLIDGRWVAENWGDPARMERQGALVHNLLRGLTGLTPIETIQVLTEVAPWIHIDQSVSPRDLLAVLRLVGAEMTVETVVTRPAVAVGEDVSPFPPAHGASVPSRLAEPRLADQLAAVGGGQRYREDP